jgi:S1-C subfamily serine protease
MLQKHRKYRIGMIRFLLAGSFVLGMSHTLSGQEEALEQSVVMIRSVSQDYNYSTPWKKQSMSQGSGTGFIVAGNRILTNAHNVSNNQYVEVRKQSSAQRYPAQIAYIGHDCDLAILTIPSNDFFADMQPLELGGIPEVNTTVFTYGFPVGGQLISVTKGVVSRVQMDLYSHTGADGHLVVQTDAAINPGNSGGPVIQDGKVVGVAFQGLRAADNIGYMIPTTVIKHFLEDIKDKTYDQYGSLGFSYFQGLHNAAYKEYLKVPQDQQGVIVLRTLLNSSAETLLKPGDVVAGFDDYDIDNDGMVRIYGRRLDMSEVIEQKLIGEFVTVTFYRAGQRHQEKLQIALNRPVLEYSLQFDTAPRYIVLAGLTFTPLSRNFLQTWGPSWITSIPHSLRYLFTSSSELNQERERKEYVVLSEIMPDAINSYADDFENLPLETINGVKIFRLEDVPGSWEKAQDGYCTLKFMGKDRLLILDAQAAKARQQAILTQYQISSDRRLEN